MIIRRSYIHIYVPVKSDGTECLRDADGLGRAYSEFKHATDAASTCDYIVVPLHWFLSKIVEKLGRDLPALRIYSKGGRTYHAELDASDEELRTLNQLTPSDHLRTPVRTAEQMRKARVWEEGK